MAVCAGTAEDHCCWIGGVVCEHLEKGTVEGRRWACGLLRRYESWDAVYLSPEWAGVRGRILESGLGDLRCGDWPRPGETCVVCGVTGG